MAKNINFDDVDGVWRTVGGRRIFIRNGQDLSSAMKESGKFKKDNTFKMNDEEKKKYEEVGNKIDDLTKEIEKESSKSFADEVKTYKLKDDNEYHTAKEVLLSRFNRTYNDDDTKKEAFEKRMNNVKILEESEGYVLYSSKSDDDFTNVNIVSSYDPHSRFKEMPSIYYEQDYKGNIKKGSVKVNWAAYGSQTPEVTKEFVKKLTEAQKFAEKINKNTRYSK